MKRKKKDLSACVCGRVSSFKIVRAISLEITPKKKFIRAGKEITIVARGTTYFFRGSKSETGLVEID